MQYNTIQYNTVQCSATQYNTIQCNAMQYTMQYNTIQYNTITCSRTFSTLVIHANRDQWLQPSFDFFCPGILYCSNWTFSHGKIDVDFPRGKSHCTQELHLKTECSCLKCMRHRREWEGRKPLCVKESMPIIWLDPPSPPPRKKKKTTRKKNREKNPHRLRLKAQLTTWPEIVSPINVGFR